MNDKLKPILIVAGILVLGIVGFVVLFLGKGKGTQTAGGPESATPPPATAPASPAGPGPGAPAGPGVASSGPGAPAPAPAAGNAAAGAAKPGTNNGKPGGAPVTQVAAALPPKPPTFTPEPPPVPPVAPSVVPPTGDPFANGPPPPPIPRGWYLDKDGILHGPPPPPPPPVMEVAMIPPVLATLSGRRPHGIGYNPTPKPYPIGRNAGWIYNSNGHFVAIFEDRDGNARTVTVGSTIEDMRVKAITPEYLVLVDANGREQQLRLQGLDTYQGKTRNVDVEATPTPKVPNWGTP
jgi:hypothetical protein